MNKIRVGLLPLYLKLYDDSFPGLRNEFTTFIEEIKGELISLELEVYVSSICRLKKEFQVTVDYFEKNNIDVLLLLHLSYSPSEEALPVLKETKIPIVFLDTTIKYEFSKNTEYNDILKNHGIHGVQDLCSVLLQNKKRFLISAGHWKYSDVLKRLFKKIKSAALARYFTRTRTGSIGGRFPGMGDFYVDARKLSSDFGIEVVEANLDEIKKLIPAENDQIIKDELNSDFNNFNLVNVSKELHLNTLRMSIATRKWLIEENLNAFTINYYGISSQSGFLTIPFLESSKAMARGIGYAGEGDTLTSSLISALLRLYPETSFIEMFCPDWKNDLIYISHMAEVNLNLLVGKPTLIEKNLPIIRISNPIVAIGQFKEGKAVLVDIAPIGENYNLILSSIRMLKIKSEIIDTISGWFRPKDSINEFLENYSEYGGTHHAAIVYGDVLEELKDFGKILGLNVIVI
ncbi:MAG: hypothetical protein M1479_01510 [Actinobacteria bacterium]|nr:hypothetical protein [Actinomycetota bacterium]MCL5770942.1 hypothetical protein [Actinomycetota bacterium]